MKIYLASRYERRFELIPIANELQDLGFEITSRWIYGNHDDLPRVTCAMEDLNDIDAAEIIVLLSGPGNLEQPERGGRHFELGYASAIGKRCFILGERENVFHHLPWMKVYPTVPELIEGLKTIKL